MGLSDQEIAIFGVFLLFIMVIGAASFVIFAFLLSKILKKAGVEGWKAWVPVYNSWIFLELGGQKGWIALLGFVGVIPVVGQILAPIAVIVAFVFSVIAAYRIGRNLEKEGPFVLLFIFLALIWFAWLAFDKSTWRPVAGSGTPGQPGYPAQPLQYTASGQPVPSAQPVQAQPAAYQQNPVPAQPLAPAPQAQHPQTPAPQQVYQQPVPAPQPQANPHQDQIPPQQPPAQQ